MTRQPDLLPIPFNPRIHRPAQLGYAKAERRDIVKKYVAAMVAGAARGIVKEALSR